MIDIWLVFNLFIPCFEILLHIYMNSLREAIGHLDKGEIGHLDKGKQQNSGQTYAVQDQSGNPEASINTVSFNYKLILIQ